jgi:hypothetical protein
VCLEHHDNKQQTSTIYNIKQQKQQHTHAHTTIKQVGSLFCCSWFFWLTRLDFCLCLEHHKNKQQTTIYNIKQQKQQHKHTQQLSRWVVYFAVPGSFGWLGWIFVGAWSVTTIRNKQHQATRIYNKNNNTHNNQHTQQLYCLGKTFDTGDIETMQNLEQENTLR